MAYSPEASTSSRKSTTPIPSVIRGRSPSPPLNLDWRALSPSFRSIQDDDAAERERARSAIAAAAEEMRAGVHYVLENFPGDSYSYLPSEFTGEPVEVEENDKVIVLEDVSEYAVRVKVAKTSIVGVLPTWTIEGALERLARLNMRMNEEATGVVTRKAYDEAREDDSDAEDSPDRTPLFVPGGFPSSPNNGYTQEKVSSGPDNAIIYDSAQSSPSGGMGGCCKKSVVFLPGDERRIYRYPAPPSLASSCNSVSDRDKDAREGGGETEDSNEWWWDGWVESCEPEKAEALPVENSWKMSRGRRRGGTMLFR